MDLNLIVVGLIIVTVVIGAYLGYLLSPQRGFPKQTAKQGALQLYSKNGLLEVPLIKKQAITHDTYLFVFGLPDPEITLGLEVGQHIAIHKVLPTKDNPEGEEIKRKYTPTSKVDQKGSFDLVIKIYRANVHPKFPEGGILTQYLESLKIGDKINISGPTGNLTYHGQGLVKIQRKDRLQTLKVKEFGLIAGGTGITPMYQIIKSILDNPADKTVVHLLFANKTVSDILIKEELEAASTDPRIKIYYTLDTPPNDWKGFSGFVTKEMLKKTMPYPTNDALICTCGPPLMNKMLLEHLSQLGYKEDYIFKF